MMKLLKYCEITVACAAIAVLSSLTLFLCSTWLLMSTPLARSIALGVLACADQDSPYSWRLPDRYRRHDPVLV